ncbi:GntR family transcriptional regulator [Sinosporangium siamense]|uniref:GntR family transcriptional regulator n=1 Tax=Sinosporangium siamense TaxID=1367973 RepID=A0A919RHV7_9ACTN|nr:GntR family transcriptional regulator [Sinosporangium siamense]GII94176.1 GntR family transcriptional regulator [Sinosporangium siamense]
MEAPYRRIAADLRRRIRAGELAPGDKTPSTRAIARDFGVALATAVRALAVLKEEGLVEARPRSGTVVAATLSRPRRHHGTAELTRERIVREAIAIADAEGLSTVTVRSVAVRLGVSAPAIYRHVRGRDDLVRTMADLAYGEERYPDAKLGRRDRLEMVARVLWRIYRRHPWLPHLTPLGRPLPLPGVVGHGEQLLLALDGLGLDPATMMTTEVMLYAYVQGLAVHLEREAQATSATGLSEEQWVDTQAGAINAMFFTGRAPLSAKLISDLGPDGFDFDLDRIFEFGLQTLLNGLGIGKAGW